VMLSSGADRKHSAQRTGIVNEQKLSRRQIVAGAGGIFMGQLIGTSSTAALDWHTVSPAEAGFADDLGARLDKAIAEKRVWNLHWLVVLRHDRLGVEGAVLLEESGG